MTAGKPRLHGRLARHWLARRGAIVAPVAPHWREGLAAVRETRARVPLLMSDGAALHLQACVLAARGLDGAMAEAGVFMGGSARLIAAAKGDAALYLFDVFETLQGAPGAAPGGSEAAVRGHFGKTHGRLDAVARLLAQYPGIRFHPGLFPDTTAGIENERFSFVHLDLDLPESTAAALAFFHPRLVPGGILLGDDYNDPGVRATFRAWFEPRGDTVIDLPWSQVMVVKQAGQAVAS